MCDIVQLSSGVSVLLAVLRIKVYEELLEVHAGTAVEHLNAADILLGDLRRSKKIGTA